MSIAIGSIIVIAVASAIPFITMWSAGQFVGQKRPHLFAQWGVLWAVSLGVLYGVVHGVRLGDLASPFGLLSVGWVAGSVISAIIALQEFHSRTKARL